MSEENKILLEKRFKALMYCASKLRKCEDNKIIDLLITTSFKQRNSLAYLLNKIYENNLSNKTNDKFFYIWITGNCNIKIDYPDDFKFNELENDFLNTFNVYEKSNNNITIKVD